MTCDPVRIGIIGAEATLHFRNDRLYGGRRGETDLQEIEIPPHQQGRWRVEQEFINPVRGLEPIKLTDFETGVKYMQFTHSVHQSLASGQIVALPPQ